MKGGSVKSVTITKADLIKAWYSFNKSDDSNRGRCAPPILYHLLRELELIQEGPMGEKRRKWSKDETMELYLVINSSPYRPTSIEHMKYVLEAMDEIDKRRGGSL